LRALVRAHQIQHNTNFMDPGLQGYGGTLFREVKDMGGKIFIGLPNPKPGYRQAEAAAGAKAVDWASVNKVLSLVVILCHVLDFQYFLYVAQLFFFFLYLWTPI
jgi:hypothetical protein